MAQSDPMENCQPYGDGCFHPQLGYIEDPEKVKESNKNKLQEEVQEFVENPCLEELADIQEVVHSLEHATSWGSLILAQLDKRCDRGSFKKKLILKEVSE